MPGTPHLPYIRTTVDGGQGSSNRALGGTGRIVMRVAVGHTRTFNTERLYIPTIRGRTTVAETVEERPVAGRQRPVLEDQDMGEQGVRERRMTEMFT